MSEQDEFPGMSSSQQNPPMDLNGSNQPSLQSFRSGMGNAMQQPVNPATLSSFQNTGSLNNQAMRQSAAMNRPTFQFNYSNALNLEQAENEFMMLFQNINGNIFLDNSQNIYAPLGKNNPFNDENRLFVE